jgi:TatD DNase family protein
MKDEEPLMTDANSSLIPHPSSLLFDTHAHLDDEAFAPDLNAVLARAEQAGVAAILCPGITADSSEAAVRLAAEQAGLVAAVGIQPNYCAQAEAGDWQRIVSLVNQPRVVAIGETGLDRHWDFTPFEVQRDYFDRHLRLAQQHGLPVIVHCREADDEVLAMLHDASGRGPLRGVLHAFSSNLEVADECLDLGLFVSFAGSVTYTNKKFEDLRKAAVTIPDDRLLIETDSPYLTPHPLRGAQKRNEPANVRLVAQCLAELRGQSVEQVAALTTENARRLFGAG